MSDEYEIIHEPSDTDKKEWFIAQEEIKTNILLDTLNRETAKAFGDKYEWVGKTDKDFVIQDRYTKQPVSDPKDMFVLKGALLDSVQLGKKISVTENAGISVANGKKALLHDLSYNLSNRLINNQIYLAHKEDFAAKLTEKTQKVFPDYQWKVEIKTKGNVPDLFLVCTDSNGNPVKGRDAEVINNALGKTFFNSAFATGNIPMNDDGTIPPKRFFRNFETGINIGKKNTFPWEHKRRFLLEKRFEKVLEKENAEFGKHGRLYKFIEKIKAFNTFFADEAKDSFGLSDTAKEILKNDGQTRTEKALKLARSYKEHPVELTKKNIEPLKKKLLSEEYRAERKELKKEDRQDVLNKILRKNASRS
jgi:hypothetical protein